MDEKSTQGMRALVITVPGEEILDPRRAHLRHPQSTERCHGMHLGVTFTPTYFIVNLLVLGRSVFVIQLSGRGDFPDNTEAEAIRDALPPEH